jgi:hypothetical protein
MITKAIQTDLVSLQKNTSLTLGTGAMRISENFPSTSLGE